MDSASKFHENKGKSEYEAQRRIGFTVLICSVLHTLPYSWNFKLQKMEILSSKRYYLYLTVCLLDLIYRLHRTFSFGWGLYNNTLTVNQAVWGALMFLTFVVSYTLQLNSLIYCKPLCEWTNAYLSLGMKLEG